MTKLSADEFFNKYTDDNKLTDLLKDGIHPDIKRIVLAAPKFSHWFVEWFTTPEYIDIYCSTECKYYSVDGEIFCQLKSVTFYSSREELEEYRQLAIQNDFSPKLSDLSQN
jgi:hypothetical protein